MGIYGADVAQLKDLADAFSRAADKIDANRMVVGHRIQLRIWVGPIAAQFRLAWDSRYSRMLHAVAEELRNAATVAWENADEQRRTSLAATSTAGSSQWAGHLPATTESQEESLERANPHYYDDMGFWEKLTGAKPDSKEYSYNCGYAAIAYEMRRRGFDVTAAPDIDGDSRESIAGAFTDPATGLPPEWAHTETKAATVDMMEQFGPGARGIVMIRWKGDESGHFFNVENIDGQVRFFDAQDNQVDVGRYFKSIEPGRVYLLRTDDQEPNMNDMVVPND